MSVKYLLSMISCLFILSVQTVAQTQTLAEADVETYQLYKNKEWKKLIKIGKQAIKNGNNSFYISVRIGIAYYEQEKHRLSIPYFYDALDYHVNDALTCEYIYWAHIFSGQEAEAQLFANKNSQHLSQTKIVATSKLIENISFEGGMTLNADHNELLAIVEDEDETFKSFSLHDNYTYYSLGIASRTKKRFRFYQKFSFLYFNKTSVIQHYTPIPPDNSPPTTLKTTNRDDAIWQFEYMLNSTIALGKGWLLSPTFHYIKNGGSATIFTEEISDNPSALIIREQNTGINLNNYVGFLGLRKSFSLADIEISGSYAKLNNQTLIQPNLSLTLYPLGNLNLYYHTEFSYQIPKGMQNSTTEYYLTDSRFIANNKVGIKLSKLWLELSATFGEFQNFVEWSGSVIYNDIDITKQKYSANVIVPIKNAKINFYFRYAYSEHEGIAESYNKDVNTYKKYTYNNHSIIGGLKWRF